jgi:tetratricopeptide (TPR) repeat protein
MTRSGSGSTDAATPRAPSPRREPGSRWRLAAGFVVGITAFGLAPGAGRPEPSAPPVEEGRQPFADEAQAEYNRGVRARVAKDWVAAAGAFWKAVTARPAFPEAWNELGYAFRNQGRYTESLDAYAEALRLRPDFPEALEYLGEAYVKMGRLDDATRVLRRLRALDGSRADELAEAITHGK